MGPGNGHLTKQKQKYALDGDQAKFEPVSEVEISRAMINRYWRDLHDYAESDVVIVGAGSAGLSCAYHLSSRHPQLKIAIIEVGYGGFGQKYNQAGLAKKKLTN